MPYAVRQASDVLLAAGDLVRLWSQNLGMRGNPQDKFDWYYAGNPLGPAAAFFLDHEAPGLSPEVVGCCGIGARTLFYEGTPVGAGLFADFAVQKAHRTVMPALMLQRALCDYARERFPVAYGFPNEAAVGIFGRIGFPLLGRTSRFVRVLRHRPFVERRLPRLPRIAARMGGAALDLLTSLRRFGRVPAEMRAHRLEWTDRVDERFDELWQRVRPRYVLIGDRSAAFLRWRFVDRPGLPSEIATLVDRAGVLRAYAVVTQKTPGEALIADFLADSDAALQALLERLSPVLRRKGFSAAVTYFLGSKGVGEVLVSAGFAFRNLAKFVVVGTGSGSPLDQSKLLQVSSLYLTEADRDN
jgi:hypothetical protein